MYAENGQVAQLVEQRTDNTRVPSGTELVAAKANIVVFDVVPEPKSGVGGGVSLRSKSGTVAK